MVRKNPKGSSLTRFRLAIGSFKQAAFLLCLEEAITIHVVDMEKVGGKRPLGKDKNRAGRWVQNRWYCALPNQTNETKMKQAVEFESEHHRCKGNYSVWKVKGNVKVFGVVLKDRTVGLVVRNAEGVLYFVIQKIMKQLLGHVLVS